MNDKKECFECGKLFDSEELIYNQEEHQVFHKYDTDELFPGCVGGDRKEYCEDCFLDYPTKQLDSFAIEIDFGEELQNLIYFNHIKELSEKIGCRIREKTLFEDFHGYYTPVYKDKRKGKKEDKEELERLCGYVSYGYFQWLKSDDIMSALNSNTELRK